VAEASSGRDAAGISEVGVSGRAWGGGIFGDHIGGMPIFADVFRVCAGGGGEVRGEARGMDGGAAGAPVSSVVEEGARGRMGPGGVMGGVDLRRWAVRSARRLAVWACEIVLEAFLLAALFLALFGGDAGLGGIWKGVAAHTGGATLLIFAGSYLVSTAITRVVWRGGTVWSYSGNAVVLFSVHFAILNSIAGGAFESPVRLRIRIVGACIVFVATLLGSLVLRRWEESGK
jgi:hypothetical protein